MFCFPKKFEFKTRISVERKKKQKEKKESKETKRRERKKENVLSKSGDALASITIIDFLISPDVTIKRIGGGGEKEGGHFSFLTGRLCIASGLQKGGKGRTRAIRGNNKAGREKVAGCKGIRAKESLLIHPGKGWLEGGDAL